MKPTRLRMTVTAMPLRALAVAAVGTALLGGPGPAASAETYALDLVAPQGYGSLINDAGTMVGTNRTVGFCPAPYPSCYSIDTVAVWPANGGAPVALPAPAGLPHVAASGMNAAGWIAGTASAASVDFKPQTVVWQPNGVGYIIHQPGLLPGNTRARVAGIDDFNRVVGYNTVDNILPTSAAPFLWTPAGGLSNLTSQGFPNEIPLAVSPAGTVALNGSWYRLNVPGVVTQNAALPAGFAGANAAARINDKGDQAKFLITGGSQNIAYLFRYIAGTQRWQQLSPAGTGHLSSFGHGSIDNDRNIPATVQGSAVFAPGPLGLAQSLTALLSPAYGGIPVTNAGPRNAGGTILANAVIGRSAGRFVRLVPVAGCTASCLRVDALQMTARRVRDCKSTSVVTAALTVNDEAGHALPGVTLSGHFLDDYYLNEAVTGITGSDGVVRFVHRGPACVGAIAFLVDSARLTGRVFDRTRGLLTSYVIPQP